MNPIYLLTKAMTGRDKMRVAQGIRQRIGIGTLSDLLTVHRQKKQAELNQRLVRKTQDGTIGKLTTEDDDVGDTINVGDTFVVGREEASTPSKPGISPWWLALPTAAAIGLGAYMLMQRGNDTPESPPVSADTNTLYDLRFAE